MNLGLESKRALVLASSQGLGLGIAEKLREEGANVLLSGRSEKKLIDEAERLTRTGPGQAFHTVSDLAEPGAAAELHSAALDLLGGVDILINNTGGPPPGKTDAPDADVWKQQFDTMAVRLIEITNLCVRDMKRSGWGRVLTVASSGVIQPIPNLSLSNTIRSALVGWNKSLANEVASSGITANLLLPGRIHTARVDQLDAAAAARTNKTVEEVAAASRATIPVGRYGTVEEFASVAAFLVSETASYVTGSVIRCDGGAIRSV